MDYTTHLLAVLLGVADLLHRCSLTQESAQLLNVVAYHPASPHVMQMQALAALRKYPANSTESVLAPKPMTINLDKIVNEVSLLLEQPLLIAMVDTPPVTRRLDQSELIEPLSEREIELLELLADGLQNREVALRLSISVNTVKTHLGNIYGKLSVTNRTQAVTRAQELGIL